MKVLDGDGASAKVGRVEFCLDVVPLVRAGHVEDVLDSCSYISFERLFGVVFFDLG